MRRDAAVLVAQQHLPGFEGRSCRPQPTPEGVLQITVRVTDAQGGFDTETFEVGVQNVAPTLTVTGAGTVTQGQVYTLNLAATDPGQDTISGWAIAWGDGSVQNVAGNPSAVTHKIGRAHV